LLERWLRERSRQRFERSVTECSERLRRYGVARPELRLRRMKKRWGSCTPRGVIHLNPQLIKAPSHCIDYVVMHELCHLKHPHHGSAFYELLRRLMPDWERRKRRLEQVTLA
jgi:predicted metal-dependent hydrolase